jgi:hypothetical protein
MVHYLDWSEPMSSHHNWDAPGDLEQGDKADDDAKSPSPTADTQTKYAQQAIHMHDPQHRSVQSQIQQQHLAEHGSATALPSVFPGITLMDPPSASPAASSSQIMYHPPARPFSAHTDAADVAAPLSNPFDMLPLLPAVGINPPDMNISPTAQPFSSPQYIQPETVQSQLNTSAAVEQTRSKKRRVVSVSTSFPSARQPSAAPDLPQTEGGGEGSARGDSAASSGSAAATARREAHRLYTAKSRSKVNSLFRELLDIMPSRLQVRSQPSKADILAFTIQQVQVLKLENKHLKMRLALTNATELSLWIADQTRSASTVRDVCHPITELFCIGLGLGAAEMWAVDSRSLNLGQAWTYSPPSVNQRTTTDQAKAAKLREFLQLGEALSFPRTNSNEACSVAFNSGIPLWVNCGSKGAGFDVRSTRGMETNCFSTRTSTASEFGISGMLLLPLRIYDQVVVACFYAKHDNAQPVDDVGILQTAWNVAQLVSAKYCVAGAP